MHTLIMAAAATLAQPIAAPAHQATPVVVVVTVPIPAGLSRAALPAEFERSVPRYRALPGLVRKYYTIGDGTFGGVYLWRSRQAAQAWFSDAWRATATRTYGTAPTVTYFDAPVVIEGTAAGAR